VEGRERQRARKPAVLTGVGLILLGLISGLYAYESLKGKDVSMKEGMQCAAADRTAVSAPVPDRTAVSAPIDVSRPGTSETATFALG
jgi:hypothetical protein